MLDENRLKRVVSAVLGIETHSVDENSNSDTIEGWDSMKQMNLVLAIEDEFGVSIPDAESANITSYPLIRLVLSELLENK